MSLSVPVLATYLYRPLHHPTGWSPSPKLAQADNRIDVSPELIDLLEMDVAIWPTDGDEQQAAVESLGTYQSLKLAKEGRSVWLKDGGGLANAAMSWQTPLSLGYLLDILPPKLAAAVDGDPATAIP